MNKIILILTLLLSVEHVQAVVTEATVNAPEKITVRGSGISGPSCCFEMVPTNTVLDLRKKVAIELGKFWGECCPVINGKKCEEGHVQLTTFLTEGQDLLDLHVIFYGTAMEIVESTIASLRNSFLDEPVPFYKYDDDPFIVEYHIRDRSFYFLKILHLIIPNDPDGSKQYRIKRAALEHFCEIQELFPELFSSGICPDIQPDDVYNSLDLSEFGEEEYPSYMEISANPNPGFSFKKEGEYKVSLSDNFHGIDQRLGIYAAWRQRNVLLPQILKILRSTDSN